MEEQTAYSLFFAGAIKVKEILNNIVALVHGRACAVLISM